MLKLVRALALLPLLASSVFAQVQGRGAICDTPEQIESFASLLIAEKMSIHDAIKQVNAKAGKENACAFGHFMVKEATENMETVRDIDIGEVYLSIKKVTIVGVWNGMGWSPINDTMVQYTVIAREAPVKPSKLGTRA